MGDNDTLSRRAKLIRDIIADFNQNDFLKSKFRDGRRSENEFDKSYRYGEGYEAKKITMDNFNMELLSPVEDANEWVLLQLHGGGYVGPLKNHYRGFAKLYSERGKGMSVLTIDYRVAPENPYPAALEDAVAAYDYLIKEGYSEDKIILGGDSAGGGLAMALCHFLKDKKRKLPAGIIAMSPWTDVALSGKSYKTNFKVDPIFGNSHEGLLYENPYPNGEDLTNPYISPLYGDFEGFPPMLIQVGGDEMLLSDSTGVEKKARRAGVDVKISIYDGMFHVFQMATKYMPESKKAWDEIGEFLDYVKKQKPSDALRTVLFERNIIWEDKNENIEALETALKKLSGKKADIILLPEMSMTGFSMNVQHTSETKEKTLSKCQKLANKYGISIGVGWVKKGENLCENHYSIVAPDMSEALLDYIKIHPFSYAKESEFFESGNSFACCQIRNVNIGATICYDLRFPELYQSMSKTADLITVAANWPAKRQLHWDTLLRARAIETQSFVAGINCIGKMNDEDYGGGSALINPSGEEMIPIEVIPVNEQDRLMIFDIINNVDEVRKEFPVKKDRKEKLYHSRSFNEKKR